MRPVRRERGKVNVLPMDAYARLAELVRRWNVSVGRVIETQTSILAFGVRQSDVVVLKVVRSPSDEWHTGGATAAFKGHGLVRVHEFEPGAVLMEQLTPGTPAVDLISACAEEEADNALMSVILEMIEISPATIGFPTSEDWGHAFDSYLSSTDRQIPAQLVQHAGETYKQLCRTQSPVRLLHGDLQHYNVLSDRTRGWAAIDPKGVVAELEFELGAVLRNPHGCPELYATAPVVVRRIDRFAARLPIDRERVAAWAYAQAVLSAIWSVEDSGTVESDAPALQLATALRPLIHLSGPRTP
jgi:streptomycin 6-kinase